MQDPVEPKQMRTKLDCVGLQDALGQIVKSFHTAKWSTKWTNLSRLANDAVSLAP